MKNKPSIRRARDWYESAGMTLIPIAPGGSGKGKAPLIETVRGKPVVWTTHPYNTARVIRQYGAQLNLGYRIDRNVVVLDYDSRAGGCRSIEELEGWLQLDGATLVGTTHVVSGGKPDQQGRRGGHIYFRLPTSFDHSAMKITETIDSLAGLEVKKIGRQVLIAGDVHPETGDYYKPAPGSVPPANMRTIPTPLLKLVTARLCKKEAPDAPGEIEPAQLAKMLEHLSPEDYASNEKWLPLMMACHQATGGDGREEFIEWSTSDPAYAHHDILIRKRWDSCDPNKEGGITARSLYEKLIEAGCPASLIPGNSPDDDFADDIDQLDMTDDQSELLDGPQSYTDEDELPKKFTFKKNAKGKTPASSNLHARTCS